MIRRLGTLFLALTILAASASFVYADSSDIEAYVTRLYEVCLGREADSMGLSDWAGLLSEGKATGTSVAYGFIFSSEFQGRDLTDEQYVECMYRAFMGRDSDEDGRNMWVSCLENGMTRQKLFEGFADSHEFGVICDRYGIVKGNYFDGYDVDQISATDLFVIRLYKNILGRLPDTQGLRNWTRGLLDGEYTGSGSAYGFFCSDEYIGQDKDGVQYITDLYITLLGRQPDGAGIDSWISLLQEGYSRERIFNGFVMSPEFGMICESYGIERGEEVPLPKDYLEITGYSLNTDSIVFVEATGGSNACVTFMRLDSTGRWQELFSVNGYIGRNGLGKQREGDGKTPVGIYHFTQAFGILEDPGCSMTYTQLTSDLYWSGDRNYRYNEMVSLIDHPELDRGPSEHLIDYSPNYNYCLNISYNENGTPGAGAAIFLHCTGPRTYTAGCVAIPQEQMRMVMRYVNENTLIVIDSEENMQDLIYAG